MFDLKSSTCYSCSLLLSFVFITIGLLNLLKLNIDGYLISKISSSVSTTLSRLLFLGLTIILLGYFEEICSSDSYLEIEVYCYFSDKLVLKEVCCYLSVFSAESA